MIMMMTINIYIYLNSTFFCQFAYVYEAPQQFLLASCTLTNLVKLVYTGSTVQGDAVTCRCTHAAGSSVNVLPAL